VGGSLVGQHEHAVKGGAEDIGLAEFQVLQEREGGEMIV
jgi:hypothetical protein